MIGKQLPANVDYMRTISDSIKRLSKNDGSIRVNIFDATVVSVDKDKRTCLVDSERYEIDDLEVRIMPEVSDGTFRVPEVDSTVMVMMSDVTEPIIISFSLLTEKIENIKDQGYTNTGDKQIFNDGGFGGLVKIQQLVENLEKLKKFAEDLKTETWKALLTIDTTAGSVSAPTFISTINAKLITAFEDMENTSITHGEKL